MLDWQIGKKRIFIKTVALIMAQVFFVTSLGYAEPVYNKAAKNLRIPMGFGKEKSVAETASRVKALMALQMQRPVFVDGENNVILQLKDGRAIEKLRIDLLDIIRQQESLVELKDIMEDPVKFSNWLINNLIKINRVDKYQVYLALMSYAGFIRARSGEAIESEKAKYFEMGENISTYAVSLKPKLEDDKEQLTRLATVFIDKLNETTGTDIQRLKQAASVVKSEEVLKLELQKEYPWRYDLLRHVLGYIEQIPEDASDIGGDITMVGSPGRFVEYLDEIFGLSENKYDYVNALIRRVKDKIQDELEKVETIEMQQAGFAGGTIKRIKQVNLDAEVPKGEQSKFRWLADNLDSYRGYDAILPVGSLFVMSGALSPYEPAGWYFNPSYGNDEDFRYLIGKAREKGIDIEIIVDVVLAHTGNDSSGTLLPDRCYLKNPDGTRVKVWGDKLDYANSETLKYGIWFLRRLKKLGVRWIRCDQMGGLGSSSNLLWSAAERLGLKMISEWENHQEVPSASIIYYKGIRNELSAWGGVSSFEKLKSMLEERLSQLPEYQSMLLILEDHDEQQKGPIINSIGKDKDGNYNLNKLKAYYLAIYMLQLLHCKRVAIMEHSGTGEGYSYPVSFMYGTQEYVNFQEETARIFPEFAEFSRRVRNLAKEAITQNSRVIELPSENPFKRTIEIYLGDKKYEIMIDLTEGNWKADLGSYVPLEDSIQAGTHSVQQMGKGLPQRLFIITLATLLLSACSVDPTFVPMLLKDVSVVFGSLLLFTGVGAATIAFLAIHDKAVNFKSVGIAIVGTALILVSAAILLTNYPLSHFAENENIAVPQEQAVLITQAPIATITPSPTLTPLPVPQEQDLALNMYGEKVVDTKEILINVILATNKTTSVNRFYIDTTWIQPNPGKAPTTILINHVNRDTISAMLTRMPETGFNIRITLEQGTYGQFIRIAEIPDTAHFSLRSGSNSLTEQFIAVQASRVGI